MSAELPPGNEGPGDMPPGDDVLAAEYVLGLLDAVSRRDVEARAQADPALAASIATWQRRFHPWVEALDPVAPSPAVWERVRRRLAVDAAPKPGLWNSLAFWRLAAGFAAAAAVAAIAIGVYQLAPRVPTGEEQAARPVTVLARDDGSAGWIASIDLAAGKVHMVPVPSPADASGRVDELWIIPAGQKPISLGFVSNEKAHSIAFPAALRSAFAAGATLAVTLEPSQGMPHAAPSGPVVAKGAIRTI